MKKFKVHMMYHPKTGKGYKANTMADHNRMDNLGYTHTKPKLNKKKTGGQVQGCGCPYGMEMGPNTVL
jgi:hypothetical protein|tara:strand:+ start:3543 stop:3746 length:204 start_codon:yes stop_codon:yes gene_type:complete